MAAMREAIRTKSVFELEYRGLTEALDAPLFGPAERETAVLWQQKAGANGALDTG